jgi:hypothetical protein
VYEGEGSLCLIYLQMKQNGETLKKLQDQAVLLKADANKVKSLSMTFLIYFSMKFLDCTDDFRMSKVYAE